MGSHIRVSRVNLPVLLALRSYIMKRGLAETLVMGEYVGECRHAN